MDVAVTGMACRFPGADDQRAYWRNLAARTASISVVPAQRWDWRRYWGDPEPVYYASKWVRVDNGGILFSDARREFEKRFITRVLGRCSGSLTKTADALGMHRHTLTRKMGQYKIRRAG